MSLYKTSYIIRITLFLFALFVNHLTFSQTAEADLQTMGTEALRLQSYAANIIQFNRHNPQEKVYLHMDNRSYFVGDTIFFKAYVLNATSHKLTRISEVLYVELLNEKGVEAERLKLKIEGGICHGGFVLKDNYRAGYYEIRAYTRHMLNFGNEKMPWINIDKYGDDNQLDPYVVPEIIPENVIKKGATTGPLAIYPTPIWNQSLVADANHCQFSRVFPVYIRPEKEGVYKREMDWYPMHSALAIPEETEEEMRDDSLRIDFYPEGGTMVANALSRIAIDVSDQWGREKTISGYIIDGRLRGDTVAVFHAGKRGRGVFSLCPEQGKNYYAHVNYKGKLYRYALPEEKRSGYVLRVTAPIAQGDAQFTVSASNTGEELLGWSLQCRGALTAFDTLRMTSGTEQKVNIPAVKLVPGVNQLTLFNARGEVLAERLFFINLPKKVPTIHLANQLPDTLHPLEKVTVDLQCNGANGYFTQAHFSLSITDAAENSATFDTGDIRSEMLLSSDLKGFIKNVDTYFRHTNDTVMRDDLDILMMVQGWRRYEWQTMAGINPYTPLYAPEYGLQLEGYVISDDTKESDFADASKYKRLGNLALHIEMKDPLITVSDTFEVDSLGQFYVDFGKDFFGDVPMSMTLLEPDGKVRKNGIYSRLKFAYPIIDRVFSPATTPYDYYQDHTPEDDEIRTAINDYDWQKQGNLEAVEVTKRRKRRGEIHLDRPDIVIDYYKEWNKTIDRGIPNANYYHSGSYYAGGENSSDFNKEKNYIRMNYTLGRHRLWGYSSRAEDTQHTYNPGRNNRYRVYLMPRTIKVYSNLLSRNPMGETLADETKRLPYYYWVPEYFKRSESPQFAPYMLKDGMRHTYYEGYSRVVSYYHRDYEEDELPKCDYRRTLYWEPDVNTTALGQVQITFFNNSRAKRIHIRAEGFTRTGEFIVYDSDKANP